MIQECENIGEKQPETFDWSKVKPAKILVAIPTLSGLIHAPLVGFLAQCIRTSYLNGPWQFDFVIIPERWPHYYARNIAVREFLKTDADKLWFIDDDMLPTPSSFAMLLHDADIVSGVYYCLKDAEDALSYRVQPVMFQRSDDGLAFKPDYPRAGDMVHPIAGAGAGCMLIKRHVLEDRRMWLPTKYLAPNGEERDYMDEQSEATWAPPIFRHLWRPGGNELRSEDLDFCARAADLGYTLVGDHESHFGHLKRVDVNKVIQTLVRIQQSEQPEAPCAKAS